MTTHSPVAVRTCSPDEEGVPNVDGQCVLGGRLLSNTTRGGDIAPLSEASSGCVAMPLYIKRDVPYTIGYKLDSSYSNLNKTHGEFTREASGRS